MTQLFSPHLFLTDHIAQNKETFLKDMSLYIESQGYTNNAKALFKSFMYIESLASTLIHHNIALPHAKSSTIDKAGILFVRLEKPIIWDKKQQLFAQIFFILIVPESILNIPEIPVIAQLVCDSQTVKQLIQLTSYDKLEQLIYYQNNREIPVKNFDIVAVTACPTGMVLTHLAANALKRSAEKKGLSIKIETHGAEGTKNTLSSEEISSAKAVIIATDKKISLSKYQHTNLIHTGAGYIVNNADDILSQIIK